MNPHAHLLNPAVGGQNRLNDCTGQPFDQIEAVVQHHAFDGFHQHAVANGQVILVFPAGGAKIKPAAHVDHEPLAQAHLFLIKPVIGIEGEIFEVNGIHGGLTGWCRSRSGRQACG